MRTQLDFKPIGTINNRIIMEISFENLPQAIANLSKKMDEVLYHLQNSEAQKQDDELMNIEEAAKYIKSTKGTLYQNKSVPRFKKMGKIYFSKKQLNEWVTKDGNVKKEHPKLELTRTKKAS